MILTNKQVAVVGSGPAGLAAAYYLRKVGHGVTVFDAMREAGGMLTHSIPELSAAQAMSSKDRSRRSKQWGSSSSWERPLRRTLLQG